MPPIRCPHAPSAARLFVQLSAARRNGSSATTVPTSTSSTSILDILLPPQARSLHSNSSRVVSRTETVTIPRTTTTTTTTAAARSSFGYGFKKHASAPLLQRRAFSTSPSLARTVTIHNPQTDEDGGDMTLEITPRAAHRLSQIMTKDENPNLALRIQVESGGCHGFQYLMSLTTLPSSSSVSSSPPSQTTTEEEVTPSTTTANKPSPPSLGEDDTIFAFAPDNSPEDGVNAYNTAPKIVLDLPSLELLKGSKVDYTMELIGSQFKIVDNPLATSSCGCGTSFDIKV